MGRIFGTYPIRHNKGKSNVVVDVLLKRHTLLISLGLKF